MLRNFLKYIASFSPIPLTKNEYYDRLTEKVIKKVCSKNSVCVDVGANKGKILSMFIKHSSAMHFAFEPVEVLYYLLVRKYGSAAKISKIALSDKKGTSTFSYVVDDPAYSSLRSRNDSHHKLIKQVEVETDCLDNLFPTNIKVDLIKLDIEGGEYDALVGAQLLLARCKPTILFEFGKGGSDSFGITPDKMYTFLTNFGYTVNLLNRYLTSKPALTQNGFKDVYDKGRDFFFVASQQPLA